jgi:hypothetical protein
VIAVYWSVSVHKILVARFLLKLAAVIVWRALIHDLSKYRWRETKHFAVTNSRMAKTTYGTPDYKALLNEIQAGVHEHYKVNSHHPEHYPTGMDGMGMVDFIEMAFDWVAASRMHHDGNPLASIEKNAVRFGYGEETKRILRKAVMFAEPDRYARHEERLHAEIDKH